MLFFNNAYKYYLELVDRNDSLFKKKVDQKAIDSLILHQYFVNPLPSEIPDKVFYSMKTFVNFPLQKLAFLIMWLANSQQKTVRFGLKDGYLFIKIG